MKITTVGIDLAKNVFQLHALMSAAERYFESNCGVNRSHHSSRTWRRA
jgi:hypothetical protein